MGSSSALFLHIETPFSGFVKPRRKKKRRFAEGRTPGAGRRESAGEGLEVGVRGGDGGETGLFDQEARDHRLLSALCERISPENAGFQAENDDFGSVVARGADPGAVRLFDPPGSSRRAIAGKTASIRVHPCPFAVENAGFQAGNLSRRGVIAIFIETCRAEGANLSRRRRERPPNGVSGRLNHETHERHEKGRVVNRL